VADAPTTLTRRGWSLVGAALGLLVAGRLLGTVELTTLGLGSAALIVVSLLWTRGRSLPVDARRAVRPSRVHVGGDARVDLELEARGPVPKLTVTEAFDGGRRAARFLSPPLDAGERARAAYRIPTDRRGRFRVGPMIIGVADPFGLSRRHVELSTGEDLIVRPRVHELRFAPEAPGRRRVRHHQQSLLPVPSPAHDEFLALRDYQVGDDLRRVHWRSTARTGELQVRDDEAAWPPHATVVLDNRAGSYAGDGYEAALEAVASVVSRLARSGRDCAVLTTNGRSLGGIRRDHGGVERLLDELAILEPDSDHPLATRRLHALAGAGLVVVVTGAPRDRQAFAELVDAGGRLVLVACADDQPAETAERRIVDGRPGRFVAAWNRVAAPRPAARRGGPRPGAA
jgi:uncharacterized protein (DUF58 family)